MRPGTRVLQRWRWLQLAAERASRRLEEAAARAIHPARVETLSFVSPLGHPLPARLHTPERPASLAVLLVPGGLDGLRGVEGLSPVLTAPRLAREGYAALAWGPSGREGTAGPEDCNGPLHQEEFAAALRLLVDRYATVAVLSISFGLSIAAGALAAKPELARRVRVVIDWEGPPHRGWFRGNRVHGPDEAWWGDREPLHHIGRVACPYWRFQSAWDHVHGADTGLGLEMVRAAMEGVSPDVRLNGSGPPFETVPLGPVAVRAQAKVLLGWLREAHART